MATHSISGQTSSASNLRYPTWQGEYRAALVEIDPARLVQRIHDAEIAIFHRLQALTQSMDDLPERQAIEYAVRALRVLKRDQLDFLDWQKK